MRCLLLKRLFKISDPSENPENSVISTKINVEHNIISIRFPNLIDSNDS